MTLIRQAPAQEHARWGSEQSLALECGLQRLELAPTPDQQATLRRYGELLLKWNRTYNLLGATSAGVMLEEHLLDSLAVLPVLSSWLPPARAAMIDVGTGAGLPGLVLAIMLPELQTVLVEPVGKKAAFLRQAVAECRLQRVKVLEERIEDVAPHELLEAPGMIPHFICRAFASLDRFAGLCSPNLRTGSLLFAMKAAKVPEELLQLSRSIEVLAIEPLRTVENNVQRNLVVMRARQAHPDSDSTRSAR